VLSISMYYYGSKLPSTDWLSLISSLAILIRPNVERKEFMRPRTLLVNSDLFEIHRTAI